MLTKIFILLFCCSFLLSACAAKPSIHDSTIRNNNVKLTPAKQDHVLDLLAFCESYSNLTPEEQKKAFTSTNQALATNKNDLVNRVKLTIMLALPSSRLRDTTKAQNMLQDLLQEDSLGPTDSALVGLLYEYTLFDNKQLQKGREETKKHEATQQKYDALLQRNDTLLQKNESLEQKNEALEQKLNELKNIEKTMNQRSTKTDNKP